MARAIKRLIEIQVEIVRVLADHEKGASVPVNDYYNDREYGHYAKEVWVVG
jgi:hypothetical protein